MDYNTYQNSPTAMAGTYGPSKADARVGRYSGKRDGLINLQTTKIESD